MPLRPFLINKLYDKQCRLNGITPSKRLPFKENLRQFFSDIRELNSNQLPPKVDLRPHMTPVEDQSKIGSCTANSLAGAYEYLIKKAHGNDVDVSRLFIYYIARTKKKNVTGITDSGCSMTHAIEALEELGTCLESIWAYDIANVNTRPHEEAFEKAKDYQITGAFQVNIDLNEMKTCLAQGFPFAFGLRLYKSFDKAAKTGVVPMPDESEQGRTEHGRHAMLAVGYSDQSKAFIVRNSWGTVWGDKGYCYIPYDYMANSKFCFDAWTVRELETNNMGCEHWDNDDVVDLVQQAIDDDDGDDYDDPEIHHLEDDGDEDDDDDEDEDDGPPNPKKLIRKIKLFAFED